MPWKPKLLAVFYVLCKQVSSMSPCAANEWAFFKGSLFGIRQGFVSSPALGSGDVVSGLAVGVESSAKRVSPPPSAEEAQPSSASSSSLSSWPGSSGRRHMQFSAPSHRESNSKKTKLLCEAEKTTTKQTDLTRLSVAPAARTRPHMAQNGRTVFLNPLLSNGTTLHSLGRSRSPMAQLSGPLYSNYSDILVCVCVFCMGVCILVHHRPRSPCC